MNLESSHIDLMYVHDTSLLRDVDIGLCKFKKGAASWNFIVVKCYLLSVCLKVMKNEGCQEGGI